MKKALSALRVFFGLFWVVFGLNGFLHFFAIPRPTDEGAAFMAALEAAGYVMPLVYGSQIIAGVMLAFGRFMLLALLILAPVVGNILLYDAFLNPPGRVIGIIILALYLTLLYSCRRCLKPLLEK